MESAPSFRKRFVRHLRANADSITDAWLDQLPHDAERGRDELWDHVPDLLEAVADLMADDADTERPPSTATDSVEAHVELRLAQGYSLERVLRQLDGLYSEVCEAMEDLVAFSSDVALHELHAVHRSLHRVFAQVGQIASRIYTDAEAEERRHIAKRLNRFARTLEHEVRGIVQRAVAAVERLKSSEAVADRNAHQQDLRVLDEAMDRMVELLTESRRLTMVEGSLGEETWIPLREVVRDVFDELEATAQSRGVELRTGDLGDDVLVSEPRLRVVIRNLVENAIKYSDPEESYPYVEVKVQRPPSDGECRLVVEDNGLGVPEESREEIFEPGVRAHPETGPGTGLGLTIVKELLEERRGTIYLESEPEAAGSRFVVELPRSLARTET